jgi:hypothetical protein
MWSFVHQIQQQLDEAAGLEATATTVPSAPMVGESEAAHSSSDVQPTPMAEEDSLPDEVVPSSREDQVGETTIIPTTSVIQDQSEEPAPYSEEKESDNVSKQNVHNDYAGDNSNKDDVAGIAATNGHKEESATQLASSRPPSTIALPIAQREVEVVATAAATVLASNPTLPPSTTVTETQSTMIQGKVVQTATTSRSQQDDTRNVSIRKGPQLQRQQQEKNQTPPPSAAVPPPSVSEQKCKASSKPISSPPPTPTPVTSPPSGPHTSAVKLTPPPSDAPLKSNNSNKSTDSNLVEVLQKEGQQLSQELGLERGKVKTLLSEKKALEARLASALQQCEEFEEERQLLQQARGTAAASEATLRERVLSLESLVARQSSELGTYGTKVASLEQRLSTESAQKEASEMNFTQQLESAEQQHNEAMKQFGSDKDRVAQSLRRTIQELDVRVSELERDLSATAQRAHQAESKLVDSHFNASSDAKELTTQLDLMSSAQSRLQQQLSTKQAECATLHATVKDCQKRATDAESALREKTTLDMGAAKQIESLEEALKKEQHKNSVITDLFDHTKKQADGMKAQIVSLRQTVSDLQQAATQQSLARIGNATAVVNKVKSSNELPIDALRGATNHDVATNGVYSAAQQSTTALPHNRTIEKELAQCTREVQRLRLVEAECEQVKKQLAMLTTQHDVVLQMFGQAQEELMDCRSDLQESKTIFRSQMDVLAQQMESAQKLRARREEAE